ncbi:radical SAM family heme chaperone HemW [Marinoscillum sp. MHG1-6]|uniref:radical SAM family heme chaperone HemW n=1 Tax=Marinoscillum sp. MHG1-6 TaxID=2959627 RepID=UPI002157B784|nr:radical SAM family heme chaperone HemW [Marinoscillum sp. MHG1-6]
MAGIYIHIPFCKQACHYCDFHFSTNLTNTNEMVRAILLELAIRKDYLGSETIETIYFGGGTPSILEEAHIAMILNRIRKNHSVGTSPEITLEANPDDLNSKKLAGLKAAGINRLSVGIQTFQDDRLKLINRTHSAREAINCIKNAQEIGFDNLTADLIYALPPEEMDYWKHDLQQMVALKLPHISLYGLTIEEKTVFGNWVAKGKLQETSEDLAANQYKYAIEYLSDLGYRQYEVSNFAKPGYESRHNSAYWSGKSYLGIGPGAHSFDGQHRSYNIRHNHKYIEAIQSGEIPETVETLSDLQRINEIILTELRTVEGIDLNSLKIRWRKDLLNDQKEEIDNLLRSDFVKLENSQLSLTTAGFMVADDIALRLFYDE